MKNEKKSTVILCELHQAHFRAGRMIKYYRAETRRLKEKIIVLEKQGNTDLSGIPTLRKGKQ